jgi:4'-phosphopantetheinyl transferase
MLTGECHETCHKCKTSLSVHTILAPGHVHIWYHLTEALDEAGVARAVAILSDAERTRARRFVFARDRRDFAAAHALTRLALSRYGDLAPERWRFQEGPDGKPSLAAGRGTPPLTFNLSHTHGLVACAIAPGVDVGIDVERVDRPVDGEEIAARFFSPGERADLARCPPEGRARRFFELWTLKEAYIKAIGKGMLHGLNTFGFALNEPGSIGFVPPSDIDRAAWQFALFAPTGLHAMAVAVRRERDWIWQIDASSHDDTVGLSPVRTSRPPGG